MAAHQGPWPRLVTSIALGRGTSLRSAQSGRVYVIICGRRGSRARDTCDSVVSTEIFNFLLDVYIDMMTSDSSLLVHYKRSV